MIEDRAIATREAAVAGPRRRPLSPATFLLRNMGKTLPLVGVILLAVLLVSGIVAMMNSIPHSIRTTYAYSKEFVAITPRGDPDLPPKIVETAKRERGSEIGRIVLCRATATQVNSIVGKWQFANVGLKPSDIPFYLDRMEVRGIKGRTPEPGKAEVLISEPVARNLRLGIGDALQKPGDQDSYSPFPVRVVGIAQTDKWIMVGDYDYQRTNHFPPVDGVLLFARDEARQEALDRWAVEAYKGQRAAVIAYHLLNRDTDLMFATLYRILNVVIFTLVLVITIMMGMLINIYQSQRLVEFGLLQALGYTKRQLLSRQLRETVIVVVVGWLCGMAGSVGLLEVVDRTLMEPNAFAFEAFDVGALLYTIPVPIAILTVAALTVIFRFRAFDPVSIVERRLV